MFSSIVFFSTDKCLHSRDSKGTPLGVLRADHLLGVSLTPGLVLELTFHTGDTDAKLCAHLQKSVLRELLKIKFVVAVRIYRWPLSSWHKMNRCLLLSFP